MKKNNFKIVIASGKGGVGKSMLASSLALLWSKNKRVVAIDADVDAPNLAIWLGGVKKWDKTEKISVSEKPKFDRKKCSSCGLCVENCQFNALKMEKNYPELNTFLCEGCGACQVVCPQNAIKFVAVKNGEIKTKKIKNNLNLISGQLYPGETGSGKIVSELKEQAEKIESDIMIIDSAAGIGCPVIASIKDSDLAVLVIEPTPSGLVDLERIIEIVDYFKIPYQIIINKWDINKDFTKKIENKFKSKILGKISYDQNIFLAVSDLKPIVETDLTAKREVSNLFRRLKKFL